MNKKMLTCFAVLLVISAFTGCNNSVNNSTNTLTEFWDVSNSVDITDSTSVVDASNDINTISETDFIEDFSTFDVTDISENIEDGYVLIQGEKYPTDITELILESITDDDIKEMHKLLNLETLIIDYWSISDCNLLSELDKLESLCIMIDSDSDLSFIKFFPNIKTLVLCTEIPMNIFPTIDLGEISEISTLIEVYVMDFNITDISQLKRLTNIKYLRIFGGEIEQPVLYELIVTLMQYDVMVYRPDMNTSS